MTPAKKQRRGRGKTWDGVGKGGQKQCQQKKNGDGDGGQAGADSGGTLDIAGGGGAEQRPDDRGATIGGESLAEARQITFSSSRPARWETPTNVPAVSKRSTNRKAKITDMSVTSRAPAISSCRKVGAGFGGAETMPWNSLSPKTMLSTVVPKIPKTMAIFCLPQLCAEPQRLRAFGPDN